MRPLPSLRQAIALGLVLAGAGGLGKAAHASDACAGVDTALTDARQQAYAELVVAALVADVQPSEVAIRNFLESGAWSAVYASTPVSEDGMFFFEEVDGHQEFQEVWGGWAGPDDRLELIAWAEDLGAPASLAACFADLVIVD